MIIIFLSNSIKWKYVSCYYIDVFQRLPKKKEESKHQQATPTTSEEDPQLINVHQLLRITLHECHCLGIAVEGDTALNFMKDSYARLSDVFEARRQVRKAIASFVNDVLSVEIRDKGDISQKVKEQLEYANFLLVI